MGTVNCFYNTHKVFIKGTVVFGDLHKCGVSYDLNQF